MFFIPTSPIARFGRGVRVRRGACATGGRGAGAGAGAGATGVCTGAGGVACRTGGAAVRGFAVRFSASHSACHCTNLHAPLAQA